MTTHGLLTGLLVAQYLLQVDSANDSLGVVGQPPGVDRRHIGKNTRFERLVDPGLVVPAPARAGRSAKLVGTPKQRAVARRRIAVARADGRFEDICERGQRRFRRIQRLQENVNARAVFLARVLTEGSLTRK